MLQHTVVLGGVIGTSWAEANIAAFLAQAKPGTKARVFTPQRSDIIKWSARVTDPAVPEGEHAAVRGRTAYESMLASKPGRGAFWTEKSPSGQTDTFGFKVEARKGVELIHTSRSNVGIGMQDPALVSVDEWLADGGVLYARAQGRSSLDWVNPATNQPVPSQGVISVYSEGYEIGVRIEIETP
jgi:hypothetical protein